MPTRLIDTVGELAGSQGFADLTVRHVLERARVSRASFYQYFEGVADCFWQSYREHADRVIDKAKKSATTGRPRELAVLDVLVDLAAESPEIAQLLMREGLAAGPRLLGERERLLGELAVAAGRGKGQKGALDIPVQPLFGGVFRFIARRLDAGENAEALRLSIHEWVDAFGVDAGEKRWSEEFDPRVPEKGGGPGRPTRRRPTGSQKERIIRGTAEMVQEKGYRETTAADIAAAAGLSRRSFYNAFDTKEAAVIATYEYAFQQTVAACTPAFFDSGTWPERIWRCGVAFSRFLASEPLLAYIGFVECYALGRGFASRVHDTQLAFTLFLEDGFRQRDQASLLSRACADLTLASVFEAGFQATLGGAGLNMRRAQPLAAFLTLAPFMGREEAGEFVLTKVEHLRGSAERAGRAQHGQPCAPSS